MKYVSTGSPQLDENLLVGFDGRPLPGLPAGRLIEVSGRPQSGVSTFCWAVALRAGQVAWVDADLCGVPAGGRQAGDEAEVVVLSPGAGAEYVEAVLREVAPLLDVLVVDSWDALAAGYAPQDRRRVLGLCADVAAQHSTTILITTKRWQSTQSGLEYTRDDALFRTYATLGLSLPRPHECEVAYSRCCLSGRSVWYDWPDRFRARLDGGFAGHYAGT